MPLIRNSSLFKRFTDFFKLKTNDFLDSEAGRMLVPVINLPVPPDIKTIIDVALNDSDKTFTVPSGKQWKLLYGFINFSATASAGNRIIQVDFRDAGGNTLYRVRALNAIIANGVENLSLGQFSNVLESVAGTHHLPIPVNSILGSGFDLRIFDSAAVDAAADDMIIRLIVEETDLTGE